MVYVFVTYNSSLEFDSPESWFQRTEAYTGAMHILARDNTVINIKQINYFGDCLYKGVHYYFPDFKESRFPLKFNNFIVSLKPDIVFIHGLHNTLRVIQLGIQLGKKTKVIAQHHAEQPLSGLKKYLQRIADRHIDAYLFASADLGLKWLKNGNISSGDKIREVMEVSSVFSPMQKSSARIKTGAQGVPVFLWVGRLDSNKDPLTVVKAFLQFAAINRSARLYMIYHTEELLPELQQLLNNSAQKNTVILIGKVPHIDLQYWFNSADIILSGSHYEGSGTAVCEAMSCGCMPIVTNIASFRMITDNGKCGLLFEPGDEVALLAALKQTQQMNIEKKQLISLSYFKSNLSFEAIAKGIEKVVSSLVK